MKTKALILAGFILLAAQTVSSQTVGTSLTNEIWSYVKPVVCGLFVGFTLIGGSIASVMIIYAGIKYLTSADDPAARKNAKDMITHAMIGIVIILIANFIVATVTQGEFFGCQYWTF
ncbi:MAG: pilin [Candidatus Altiarchaeota archaeon]